MILSLAEEDLPDGLDHFRNVDAFGTAGITGQARGTDPDGFGFKKFLFESELSVSYDLVGENVHIRDGRAASGTFAALITDKKVLTTQFLDFGNEGVPGPSFGYIDSHSRCPLLVKSFLDYNSIYIV